MLVTNRIFQRNAKLGTDACEILSTALEAVDPYRCVSEQLAVENQHLRIGQIEFSLDQFERIFLIGFGKAAVPMAKAVIDKIGDRLTQANVITKDAKYVADDGYNGKLKVHLGGHPVPSLESVSATKAVLSSLPSFTKNDLVLVMISGGGSALFTDPVPGVTLDDLKCVNQVLINSGATIDEINTIRKHLDQVKGGRLALRLQPACVQVLILSDVIGDRLDSIASGPTVPDPTTFQDAIDILVRYGVLNQLPSEILDFLEDGQAGKVFETQKPGDLLAGSIHHHLVGSNFVAAHAAYQHALNLGYNTVLISTALTGLTCHVAGFLKGIIQSVLNNAHPVSKPACLIFGGEPTVNVVGDGLGGRNMDLVMRMVPSLAGKDGVLFISMASDGEDGPTDAAGAVADSQVYDDGKDKYGLIIHDFIQNNDAYHYHEKVGGLIKTGATGTNVNDLIVVLIA